MEKKIRGKMSQEKKIEPEKKFFKKFRYPNGDVYEGEFLYNLRHGNGEYRFAIGDTYIGDWVDDRKCGVGRYFYLSGGILHTLILTSAN